MAFFIFIKHTSNGWNISRRNELQIDNIVNRGNSLKFQTFSLLLCSAVAKRPLNGSYLSDWINKITRALKRIVIHRERERGVREGRRKSRKENQFVRYHWTSSHPEFNDPLTTRSFSQNIFIRSSCIKSSYINSSLRSLHTIIEMSLASNSHFRLLIPYENPLIAKSIEPSVPSELCDWSVISDVLFMEPIFQVGSMCAHTDGVESSMN